MKLRYKFIRNILAVISIAIAALSLGACGGSSTGVNLNETVNPPQFFRNKITLSPRYSPSGDITQTKPTFSWQAIANATDYRFGHENTANETEWHLYYTSPTQADCQNIGDTCAYTPTNYTFPLNVEKVWWVQAKVNGNWQDWSRPIVFTVVDGGNNGSIPTAIAPSGSINMANPEFSWTSVNGASAYKLGHEDANTAEGWQMHNLSVTDANCQSAQTCSYTPANPGFTSGQEIAWWVKAKVNGVWGDWSEVTVFNVSQGQHERPFILQVQGYKTGFRQVRYFKDFTIFTNGSGYNYNVDCDSDGTLEASNVTGTYTCRYPDLSRYRLSITGDFPRFTVSNGLPSKNERILKEVEQWGTQQWRSMEDAFKSAMSINITATDLPDLSQVSSMKGMFEKVQVLNAHNISEWDVSHVTDMSRLFHGIQGFNSDLSNWDVSNVTNMSHMFFYNRKFNQNIGNWDVSNVTDMSGMFRYANDFNQDLGSWNVSKVTDMSHMFNATDFNHDIGNWDVSNVTNMEQIFNDADFNQDISNWDVGNVSNMQGMFVYSNAFNQPIGNWDVSNVVNMGSLFLESHFNQDISNWDVSNVTNMRFLFAYTDTFNQNISHWNVSKVTDMDNMFYKAKAFDQDLGNWDVSLVSNMSRMFDEGNLSTANYDSLLNNWSLLSLQQNVPFSAGETKYSASSVNARAILTNQFLWQITDGGQQ